MQEINRDDRMANEREFNQFAERDNDGLIALQDNAYARGYQRGKVDAENSLDEVLMLAEKYAGIEGDHHRMWVIDQMIRLLLGDKYDQWVAMYNSAQDSDDWDTGIAP